MTPKLLASTPFALASALIVLAGAVATPAHADAQFPPIRFTEDEIVSHRFSLPILMDETVRCLDETYTRQVHHYLDWGISAFFGEASDYLLKMDDAQRKAYLKANLKPIDKRPVTDELVAEIQSKLKRTSCVGITFKCMGRGFEAAGQKPLWEKLKRYTIENGTDGSALQAGLQALGWKLVYWNPDPKMSAQFDAQEKGFFPPYKHQSAYGQHEKRWNHLLKTGEYYRNTVDDFTTLVGYGHGGKGLVAKVQATGYEFVNAFQFQMCEAPKSGGLFSRRPKPSYSACIPEKVRRLPFFLGTAHAGFHVFLGHYGKVTESHAAMELTNSRLVERGDFFGGAVGMSPKYNYYSGLIAVPPGYGF